MADKKTDADLADEARLAEAERAPSSPVDIAAAVQREQAAIAADLEAHPRDETVPGGHYLLADRETRVNAYGNEIDEKGNLKNPQDALKQTI